MSLNQIEGRLCAHCQSRLEMRAEEEKHRKALGPMRNQRLRKDEQLRTQRRCVAIVTSVGCSFSGSRCCMSTTYWDLVTITTQPPQSVTLLKKRARERKQDQPDEERVGRLNPEMEGASLFHFDPCIFTSTCL